MANKANENAPEKDNKPEGGEEDADTKLANLVNSAVTSQLKRHMKNLGDQFGSMLDERLAALQPKPAAQQGQQGASAASDSDAMKEVEKLRGELKAQKQRAAEKEVYADVRSILTGKVREEAMDTAIKVLRSDGVIKIDARDGSATFKHSELGDVDLSEGLTEWLKGEGALFAPVAQAKRTPVRGASRAHARRTATNDDNLTPAQKTARDLQARGFTLG